VALIIWLVSAVVAMLGAYCYVRFFNFYRQHIFFISAMFGHYLLG
jgi:hypothetical protein